MIFNVREKFTLKVVNLVKVLMKRKIRYSDYGFIKKNFENGNRTPFTGANYSTFRPSRGHTFYSTNSGGHFAKYWGRGAKFSTCMPLVSV